MKHKLIYISNKQILPKIQPKSEKDALVLPFPLFQLSCTVGDSMNMKEVASFIADKVRIICCEIISA